MCEYDYEYPLIVDTFKILIKNTHLQQRLELLYSRNLVYQIWTLYV